MKGKLTETLVQRLISDRSPGRKKQTYETPRSRGLMLCINHRSSSYTYQADLWRDKRLVRTVRMKLGDPEVMSLSDARHAAQEVRLKVRRGIDPNPRHGVQAATLGDAWLAYDRDLVKRGRSPKTLRCHRSWAKLFPKRWMERTLLDIGKNPRDGPSGLALIFAP